MLMDEVVGQFIQPFPSTPVRDIPDVYGQVADIVLSLSEITFDKIGMLSENTAAHDHAVDKSLFDDLMVGPAFSTATEYYIVRFERFLEEKRNDIPMDDDWVAFAWLCL